MIAANNSSKLLSPRMATFATVALRNGALVFTIEKLLESPNASRGHHWSRRHRITREWESAIGYALGHPWRPTWSLITGAKRTAAGKVRPIYRQERRRVTIERRVPSARNFTRDRDNVWFLGKPVYDALVRLGLLCADTERWSDAAKPVQTVSDDGRAWTIITIARIIDESRQVA